MAIMLPGLTPDDRFPFHLQVIECEHPDGSISRIGDHRMAALAVTGNRVETGMSLNAAGSNRD
ncbi:MAG UNVERIFIED_CONTAM: hypothetical protein LVR18_32420 [Planctomycetaceae bacterium]|jgi:hypothetical protein